jgi:hypothetical protein
MGEKVSNLAVVYDIEEELEIVKGETIKFVSDYHVWEHNVKGMKGIIAMVETTSGKPLVYIEEIEEWCEPTREMYERVRPGYVKRKTKSFLKRTKTLEYSC